MTGIETTCKDGCLEKTIYVAMLKVKKAVEKNGEGLREKFLNQNLFHSQVGYYKPESETEFGN